MKTINQILGAAAIAALVAVSLQAEPLTSPKQSGQSAPAVSAQNDANTVPTGSNFAGEAAKTKAAGSGVVAASADKGINSLACENQTGKHGVVKDCCKVAESACCKASGHMVK